MKHIILSLCLAAATTGAQAQYFQKRYADDSRLHNGMITRSTGSGHVMAGVSHVCASPGMCDYDLMVIRTDIDGDFTSFINFNNSYALTDMAGYRLQFNSGHVVEFSDGTGYGVIGSYSYYFDQQFKTGIAYIRLDTRGGVLAVKGYEMPAGYYSYSLNVSSTYESTSTPGDIVATGQFVSNGEEAYMWAMRIDQAGNMLWGNMYNFITSPIVCFETPYDIIESPYNNDIYVVGSLFLPGFNFNPVVAQEDAFWLTLNPANGTVTNLQSFDAGQLEMFSAINVSNDPNNPGFILCGRQQDDPCNYPNNYDLIWIMKTDQNFTPQWSNLYKENTGTFEHFETHDVVGRLNTSGNYEYYVTGRKDLAYPDAIVVKVNDNGQPVNPGSMFVYTTGANLSEWGNRIDVNTSGTGDGVSMYGIWEDPWGTTFTSSAYLVKAYFNGESGCNQDFRDLFEQPAPANPYPTPTTEVPMVDIQLNYLNMVNNNQTDLCYNATIGTGDNTFVMPSASTKPKSLPRESGNISMFPNPLTTESGTLTLHVPATAKGTVVVVLSDIQGRQLFTQNYAVEKGGNFLQADISKLQLPVGLYNVSVQGASGTALLKLTVTR